MADKVKLTPPMTDSKTPEWAGQAADRVGEDIYGRHERGFIMWPLISESGTPLRDAISQALLSAYERGKAERAAEIAALLADPIAVRANYMRGGIACQSLIDEGVERGRKEGVEDAAKVADRHTIEPDPDEEDPYDEWEMGGRSSARFIATAIRQLLEVKG